jgi:hypothetical protein
MLLATTIPRKSEIIYSPWLANKKLENQLAFGSIQFDF